MGDHLTADQLSRELRTGSGAFLKRRRRILGLIFISCSALAVVALYQVGILKKLPGPRWRGFDAEKVNGSAQAYSILATPDALLGLASYTVTACLTGLGPENRWQTRPLLSIAMGSKLVADVVLAGKLTLDEATKYRAFSIWSVLTASATLATLPPAIPELKAALRQLAGGNRA